MHMVATDCNGEMPNTTKLLTARHVSDLACNPDAIALIAIKPTATFAHSWFSIIARAAVTGTGLSHTVPGLRMSGAIMVS